MVIKTFALILLVGIETLSAQEQRPFGYRKQCPVSPDPSPIRTMEELQPILRAKRIEILRDNTVTPINVERFLVEYNKMPSHFADELLAGRASVRIMEGTGVGIDPSLREVKTTEGTRLWDDTPGGGGFPRQRVPTRIAINHLHDNHGASNLFLHEQAHTLDNLYGDHALSSSPTFTNLLANAPGSREFLETICSDQYCTPDKSIEAFAELFSYYHACGETKSHMEASVPEIAAFFGQFTSARAMLDGDLANLASVSAMTRTPATTHPTSPATTALTPATENCDTSPAADLNPSVKDFAAVTKKLQMVYPSNPSSTFRSGPTIRSGSTDVSASGLK